MRLHLFLSNVLFGIFIILGQPLFTMDLQPLPAETPPAATPQETPPPPPTTPQEATTPPATTPPVAPPPAATDAPTTPEAPLLQSEQLKWPDTIEIGENTQGLVQTNNPQIIALYKKAEKTTNDCFKKSEEIAKTYGTLLEKFEATNSQLDTFFQEITYQKGKIEESFIPRKLKDEKTTQPITNKK